MKTKFPVLLAAIALAVSSNIYAAENADAHHHSHGSTEPTKLQFNAGKKWATDQPLRQAMSDINQAMAKALPAIHKNQFGNGEYQALATTVSEKVAYAVENCKLEPKADAMLHLVIADLMAGAESMEGKTAKSRHDGAVQVLEALKSYGKYFQHTGWKTAKG
jgi:hypothetical protein